MNELKKWINPKTFWMTFLALMFVKYGYYGFKYYPVLDDWIQYGGYPRYPDVFRDVILGMSTYTTRPLASLSDPYLWGQFWGVMGIPFFLITMMHAASAYFLVKVAEYHKLPVGMPFLIVYGLLPLGTEATYWISASSRLVVGVFWMALALYILTLYIKHRKQVYLWIFLVLHLISLGYYEQVIIISCFCAVLILLVNWRRLPSKLAMVVPFFNFLVIAAYYKAFDSSGNVAARGRFIQKEYLTHFGKVIDAVCDIFFGVQAALMKNGFRRGLKVFLDHGSYAYFLLIILLSIAAGVFGVYFLVKGKKAGNGAEDNHPPSYIMCIAALLLGFILFWIPLAINFLLEVIWISNRNMFTSFIGLALMVEGMLGLIFRGRVGDILRGMGIAVVTLMLLVVNVSEITDYKKTGEIDRQICENIIASIDDPSFYQGERRAILLNPDATYVRQNSFYHDHILNATSSDWALTGAVRAVAGNMKIKQFITQAWPGSGIKIDDEAWNSAIILAIEKDLSVVPLRVKGPIGKKVNLYTIDGQEYGFAELLEGRGGYYFSR